MKLKSHSNVMITLTLITTALVVAAFAWSHQVNYQYQVVEKTSNTLSNTTNLLESITFDIYENINSQATKHWFRTYRSMDEEVKNFVEGSWVQESSRQQLLQSLSTTRTLMNRYLDELKNRDIDKHAKSSLVKYDHYQQLKSIIFSIKDLDNNLMSATHEAQNHIEKIRVRISWVQAGLLAILVIMIFTTAFFIVFQVLSPLKEMNLSFHIVSNGNFKHRIKYMPENEFGDLARSFNTMIENIRQVTASRNELEREIETRKLAVQANTYQAERFHTILYHYPGILYVVDPKTREILFANKMLTERLGDDLIGKTCYKELQGYDLACQTCHDNYIDDGEKPKSYIFHSKKLNIDMMLYEELLTWPDGREVLLKVGIDITQQKKMEHELYMNQERLEALLGLYAIAENTEDEIIEYALESAVKLSQSKIGYLHFVNDNQVELELFTWSKEVYKDCTAEINRHYPLEKAGIWADCVRTGEPAIHNDYATTGEKQGLPQGHIPLTKHMSVPIYDGKMIIAIVGVGNKIENYENIDVKQLTLFIQGMWSILRRKRAEGRYGSTEK